MTLVSDEAVPNFDRLILGYDVESVIETANGKYKLTISSLKSVLPKAVIQ